MLSRSKIKIFSIVILSLVSSTAFASSGQPISNEQSTTLAASTKATAKQNAVEPQIEMKENLPLPEIVKQGNAFSFTLSNGMQVVVLPNHRAPVVANMVWYRAGSADEPAGHTGIAHFFEHLMFKGTKENPAGKYSNLISKVGGEENAFTSSDFTGYYEIVAPQYLKDMMEREADRMENLILTDDVIGPEREVIIEERRMRVDNDPASILQEEARATLFLNSPYRNPVIGWKQEMEKLSREDALDFYKKFYTPNNAIALIVGDVNPEEVRALAINTYGQVKQRAETPKRIRPQEPKSNTYREVVLHDPRVSEPSFVSYRIVPSYNNAKNEKDPAALDLLVSILGGGTQSRLYQNLVVKNGIAASVGTFYEGAAIDDGVLYVYGQPRGDATLDQLMSAINEQLTDLIKNGVTQQELDDARRRYKKEFIFNQDSLSGMMQLYGSMLTVNQSVEDVNNWPEKLETITPADIKAVAAQYLQPGQGVVSKLLPEENSAPKDEPQSSPKTTDETVE